MFAFDVGFPSWGYQVGLRCGFCIWGLRARFQAGAFQCGCSFIYFLSGRACGVVTMVMTRWFFVLRFFSSFAVSRLPSRGSDHGYGAMVFAASFQDVFNSVFFCRAAHAG